MRLYNQIISAMLIIAAVSSCTEINGTIPLNNEAASSTPCLNKGLIFSEDFESENYGNNWSVHWGSAVGAGTVASPPKLVYGGRHSAYNEIKRGSHSALGSGEFVPVAPVDDVAFMRIHLMLQENFSMGRCRSMKLFGLRGGATIENAYGGACSRPNGKDKFSVKLIMDNWSELALYYYHPDQTGLCGDIRYSRKLFGGPKLLPGIWYCLELMVKLNTPGKHDGVVLLWVDGKPAIRIDNLRFRDMDTLKIRRFTIETYFGGALASDTSPKDQRVYIDDLAIGKCPIGCAD
jgi:hypothetical protein